MGCVDQELVFIKKFGELLPILKPVYGDLKVSLLHPYRSLNTRDHLGRLYCTERESGLQAMGEVVVGGVGAR